MDELIKQFNDIKKFKKEVTIAMILLIVAGVGVIVMGFVIDFLPILFIILGCFFCLAGVSIYIVWSKMIAKAKKMIIETLDNLKLPPDELAKAKSEMGLE